MKKLTFSNFLSAIGIPIFATILSCEGPEGPIGPQGPEGLQGSSGSSCSVVDNGDGTYTMTCPEIALLHLVNQKSHPLTRTLM